MIDFHCHILPFIKGDDGSSDWDESIKIARKLVHSGFTKVYATPHCIEGQIPFDSADVATRVEKLNELLAGESIPLQVFSGSEILFHNEILKSVQKGQTVGMGKSKYILIELPMHEFPESTLDLVKELVREGYFPVIAHPERNRVISAAPERLLELIEKGAYAQLNLCSLTGVYGSTAEKTAELLLKAGSYSFVGTDLHKANLELEPALKKLKHMCSPDQFERITLYNGLDVEHNVCVAIELETTALKGVISPEKVKGKKKKSKVIRNILISISIICLLLTGGAVYADYKIQQEIEVTLESVGLDADGNIDLDKLLGTETTTTQTTPTNSGSVITTTNANGSVGTVETNTNGTSGTASTTTGKTTGNNTAPVNTTTKPADATTQKASASLKKLTLAEKAQAYAIVMGKLTPETITKMKSLAAGGFTSEEKQEAKDIFYSTFTAEEQQFLLGLYSKGK